MPKILIVGGGYAGFYTAWKLEKWLRAGEAEVTVVDPLPLFLTRITLGSRRSVIGSSGAGGDEAWMNVPSVSTSLAPSEAEIANCRVTSRPGSGG